MSKTLISEQGHTLNQVMTSLERTDPGQWVLYPVVGVGRAFSYAFSEELQAVIERQKGGRIYGVSIQERTNNPPTCMGAIFSTPSQNEGVYFASLISEGREPEEHERCKNLVEKIEQDITTGRPKREQEKRREQIEVFLGGKGR